MMRRNLCFLILINCFLCLQGCGENDNTIINDDEVILDVSKTSFEFGQEGGSEKFSITSNAIWKIQYESSLWSRPSLQTTKGDAEVTLTVDTNETTEARNMSLTLTSEGVDDIIITVTQEGKEPDAEEPEDPDYIEPDNTGMRELTSVELTDLMGVGWNLGNSLEAINANGGVYTGSEVSWGNPVVNKDLINEVKAAGFNTVRIPVSWSHMIEDESTFKISYEWKQRVEEVVNYALENDMFVIINIHWDGGWMDHPTYDNQEAINNKLAALWKQISIFFRDYDDHLLFAGTNEVHVVDNYNAPSAENAEVQNSFNQTFITTVRNTGGKNTFRHLVVQAYNTNIGYAVDDMTIPDDPANDRLMVEVHFYDPYQFALQEDGGVGLWGQENAGSPAHAGWGDEDWVDEAFGDMKTNFVDAGYGVILGEYGALLRTNPANTTYEAHVEARNYYLNYVTKAALDNGMVPVYWDNGYTGNNSFGLFNRTTGSPEHEDAVEAIVSALD